MKKRINLLSKKKRFNQFAKYVKIIKHLGSIGGIIFFILFILIAYQTITIRKEIGDLTKKKQLYLSLLTEQKDEEANTRYFKGKLTQLNKYELDDVRFVPYYTILVTAIGSSSQSATLDTIDIDKNRVSSFVVKFKDYEGMISFLKYVESFDFLKNFEELTLASLNLSRSQSAVSTEKNASIKSYQLQFTGKFKAIQ